MSTEVADAYAKRREQVEARFVEEARQTELKELVSPSGRYRLQISRYTNGPGAWSYTRGEVFRVKDGARVADVKRNYSSFWSCWAEDHPVTGHDYLLCGEDYQGHTVVDLTTGEVMNHWPEGALKGHGWCIAGAELMPDRVTLRVNGCFWGGPYEIRLHDFSDPMPDAHGGLKNLTEGTYLDLDDDVEVSIADDAARTLVWSRYEKVFRETGEWKQDLEPRTGDERREEHLARKSGDPERIRRAVQARDEALARHDAKYDEDDETLWERRLYHRRVLRLVDGAYEEVEDQEYKCDALKEREASGLAWERADEARYAKFRDGDLVYQLTKTRWPDLPRRTSRWYPSTHARWDGDNNAFYVTVEVGKSSLCSASIEWGEAEGGLTAVIWRYGKGNEKISGFARDERGFSEAVRRCEEELNLGGQDVEA